MSYDPTVAYGQPGGPTPCTKCGYILPPGSTICNNCGTPVASAGAPQPSQPGNAQWQQPQQPGVSMPPQMPPASQPVSQPPYSNYQGQQPFQQPSQPQYSQPSQPQYSQPAQPPYSQPAQPQYSQPAPGVYGTPASQPAYGSAAVGVATMPPQVKSGNGKLWLIIGGVVLVLLLALGGGAYYVYAAFLSFNQQATAKLLPKNTFLYTSADLLKFDTDSNNHGVKIADLIKSFDQNSDLKNQTGITFSNDVEPWIGQGISAALAPFSNTSNTSNNAYAFFISTRDSSKSDQTIQKILDKQQQLNSITFSTTSYSGITIRFNSDSKDTASSGDGVAIATVQNNVVMTNNLNFLEGIIDRSQGKDSNDILANDPDFQKEMGKIPGNQFVSIYENSLNLVNSLPADQVNDQGKQFAQAYPLGEGFVAWNSQGLDTEFSMPAVNQNFLKFTTSGNGPELASAFPSNTAAFMSIGNLSGIYNAITSIAGTDEASQLNSSIQQATGLSVNDPIFSQPAAIGVLPTQSQILGTTEPDMIFALNTTNGSDVLNKAQAVMNQLGIPVQDTTVQGTPVKEISLGSNSIYFGVLGNSFIIADSDAAIQAAVQTSKNPGASLAQASNFQQLAKNTNNSFVFYADKSNLDNSFGATNDMYRQVNDQLAGDPIWDKTTAFFSVFTWDTSGISVSSTNVMK